MPTGVYQHKKGIHKGQIAWNKGKKITTNTGKTWFKKGHKGYWVGKKRSEKTKEKIVKSLLGKIGEDSRNWKGGVDIENKRIRRSLEYEIWRNEVYKRDNWKCRLCGSKKQIIAHHIELFSDYPELRFSVENGITLCRNCHAKIHKLKL